MAEILIKRIPPKCSGSISEIMSTSLTVLEIASLNPTESVTIATGIYDTFTNPLESMVFTN